MNVCMDIGYVIYPDFLREAIVNSSIRWKQTSYTADQYPDLASLPITEDMVHMVMFIDNHVANVIDNLDLLSRLKVEAQNRFLEKLNKYIKIHKEREGVVL